MAAPGDVGADLSAPPPVDAETLEHFVGRVLRAVGLPDGDADKVARLIVTADLQGADGHGVFRLPQYVRRIRAGGINVRPRIQVVRQSGATALVDGDNGMGHLAVSFAAERAIEIATETGIAWVGVRRGNHAGPASLYAAMPVEQDQIGIYFAIGNANHLAPWGGVEPLLSTNPIAIAVPAGECPPVVLDMATSVVSFGTIKRYAKRNEPMPPGWMIDKRGEPLLDPTRADEGLLLPLGGYKGYGLSLMITFLAGVLNGAAFGRDVVDFNRDDVTPTNTGQAIAAIDIAHFREPGSFKAAVDEFVTELARSRTLPNVRAVRVPGERTHRTFKQRSREGIPLSAALRSELDELAGSLGLERLPAA